jgi:membrane-associated phospholipid phosphatase
MSASGFVRQGHPPLLDRLKADALDFRRRWASSDAGPSLSGLAPTATLLVCLAIVATALLLDARDPPLIEGLAPFWRKIAEVVTRLGLSGYIFATGAAVCFAALALRGRGRGRMADAELGLLAGRSFFVIVVNAVSGLASQILKHAIGRARPQLMAELGPFHFDLFSIKAKLASFPSGHAVTVFATAAALSYFMPRLKIPLYFVAIAVGISRLILLAHYPSDVLTGAALGWATTYVLARLFARRRIVFAYTDGRAQSRAPGAVARLGRAFGLGRRT